jgi:phage terminase large subunit
VEIVIDYEPRTLQRVIHDKLEQHLRGVAVCHRRFGKTVLAVNHLQKAALICRNTRPRFAYIAPTFTQGKSIAWDYMKYYASPLVGIRCMSPKLRVDYPNGGQVGSTGPTIRIVSAGLYFDGVVLDEYGLMPPRIFSEVVSPTLVDRQGWAFFIGTPNGKNQFYDVAQKSKDDPEWFFVEHKASQTGHYPRRASEARTRADDAG